MKLSDFDFNLPAELIAQYPCSPRSASRLLCLDKNTGKITHKLFNELPELLLPHDLLVFNDTKVIPARIFGNKITGGKVEILVERILTEDRILAHIGANKKVKIGTKILFDSIFDRQADNLKHEVSITAEVVDRNEGLFELVFHFTEESILKVLEKIGHVPLPPYINRSDEALDGKCYQTIFAKNEGAVAAPTAGLHFDECLLNKLKEKKVGIGFITLHVGSGTFRPIREDEIRKHKMHAEYFAISSSLCEQVQKTKKQGGRIIAVGTTTVRTLESVAAKYGELCPCEGYTDIFIYPGYSFNCIDAMITNFHLPKSTLILLICAFSNYENIMRSYKEAIARSYRFFSYGDAMFIS